MFRRLLLLVVVATCSIGAEPCNISSALDAIRAKYKVPACAAAVIEKGRIVAIGSSGLRRNDRAVPVTNADIWHTGSCTKTMTAALIGMLIDEGKLRWDMTIPETLPGLPFHPGWKAVTLDHLVTQRSGIARMSTGAWRALKVEGATPREQRATYARALLAEPPAQPPGKFEYSNSGYGLLGAILERATGKTYEELLRQRIFTPLGLKTAGLGAPATPGKLDQPWGHRRNGDLLTPVEPTPASQFPTVLSPAASVHMSLEDFARFADWVSTNEPTLLKTDTFAKLKSPPEGSSYAGGLWTTEMPGIGGPAVSHCGHMGGFFAVYHAGRERACVSVFNTEGGGWEWLGDEIAAAALKAAK